MELIKYNIDELKKAEYNPRKQLTPEDKEYQKIKNSIEEFGYVEPIIINKDKTIIGGHQRLNVLKDLGYTEVECIEVELDKIKEKALNIALNKITGEWDYSKLGDLLLELDSENYNLELTGFEDFEIESIMAPVGIDEEQEIIEDEVPEVPEEPTAKLGDIYQLGNHRLMCGDSTNPDDVDKLMNGEVADLVFTDPPYGVSYKGTNNPNGREWEIIKNDKLRGDELFLFLLEAFKNIKRKLKVGGAYYIWYANSNSIQFETALDGAELRKKQIIIWQKGMVLGHSDYHWTYEPCLYGCHPEQNCEWYGDRTQKTLWDLSKKELKDMKKDELLNIVERLYKDKDVWEIKRDNVMEYVHPTQKPVALSAKAMHNSSKKGDIVLDLFGGSGSTLIGCEQLDRKARIMEFDPHYVDVIIQRWENFTGQKAVKLN